MGNKDKNHCVAKERSMSSIQCLYYLEEKKKKKKFFLLNASLAFFVL